MYLSLGATSHGYHGNVIPTSCPLVWYESGDDSAMGEGFGGPLSSVGRCPTPRTAREPSEDQEKAVAKDRKSNTVSVFPSLPRLRPASFNNSGTMHSSDPSGAKQRLRKVKPGGIAKRLMLSVLRLYIRPTMLHCVRGGLHDIATVAR